MKTVIEREVACTLCKGKGVKATGWDYFASIFTFGLPFMIGLGECPKCEGTGKTTMRETTVEEETN